MDPARLATPNANSCGVALIYTIETGFYSSRTNKQQVAAAAVNEHTRPIFSVGYVCACCAAGENTYIHTAQRTCSPCDAAHRCVVKKNLPTAKLPQDTSAKPPKKLPTYLPTEGCVKGVMVPHHKITATTATPPPTQPPRATKRDIGAHDPIQSLKSTNPTQPSTHLSRPRQALGDGVRDDEGHDRGHKGYASQVLHLV